MTLAGANPRPFTSAADAALVLATLPWDDPEADVRAALSTPLLHEVPELEADVGCPVTPRAVRPGIVATISTALTYDRGGRRIEGNGFAPDIPITADPTDPDATLRHATVGW